MEEQPVRGMGVRYALFVILSIGILALNAYLMSRWAPPKPPLAEPPPLAQAAKSPAKLEAAVGPAKAAEKVEAPPAQPKPDAEKPAPKPPAVEVQAPDQWVALGSLDPNGQYRMLVTLTNRGAAVQRIELSTPRFHDSEDRSGYLGHVAGDEAARGEGCLVQVVGHGTPAQQAGLVPGDRIKAVDGAPVSGPNSLAAALHETKPGQTVRLTVARNGQELELPVQLARRPLAVIRPESPAPPSFRVALAQIDDQTASPPAEPGGAAQGSGDLEAEIDGARLRDVNWEIVSHDESHATFRRALPQWGLEVLKTFRLAKIQPGDGKRENARDHHLTFDLEIRNTGKAARKVAYSVDGPNGLPTDGWWYASKVSRTWSAVGLRDVIVSFQGDVHAISAIQIGGGDTQPRQRAGNEPMSYVGVDAQYFASLLIPQPSEPAVVRFAQWQPLGYGVFEPDQRSLTNVSFRATSTLRELNPGAAMVEAFEIFAGPKRPDLLGQYGLEDIITYGWFGPVARLLLAILHTFYLVIPNYGVAIILLTVLVRSCMFPLSKKQALSAQKMQELQPEIKRIQEKYKNNLEARSKAQQELFRKHNYNPMGGCLILFLQLPIFIGLYRALMVDVELYQAPLIAERIRWASNLAAPDMLFDWSGFMPSFITRGTGMFGLGPYFNLLPLLTIFLFIWQQKKFMPPPTDEQQAMQQKIMQFMMIFMGILFFKVASGLCIYFIASSLWSIAERKFLPKTAAAGGGPAPAAPSPRPAAAGNGSPLAKRKVRGRGRR